MGYQDRERQHEVPVTYSGSRSHRAGVVVEKVIDQRTVRQIVQQRWRDVIHTVNDQERDRVIVF